MIGVLSMISRYMFRRCQFLEESPYLKFNVGSGILKPGQREATDTSKLRSVLFETMLDEVSDFCQQYDQRKSHYHQVSHVYLSSKLMCFPVGL